MQTYFPGVLIRQQQRRSLTNHCTLICHQRSQSFYFVYTHIGAVTDTWLFKKKKKDGVRKKGMYLEHPSSALKKIQELKNVHTF